MNMKSNLGQRLTLLLLAVMSILCAAAQNTTATVTGKVTDKQGEPIIGATITIKNESTGFTANSVTDIDGTYRVVQ